MPPRSLTYREIQEWVHDHHGFRPKTCWIAHCKELCGLPLRKAPNRKSLTRREPCPPDKQAAIKAAFDHFGMLHPPMNQGVLVMSKVPTDPAELSKWAEEVARALNPKPKRTSCSPKRKGERGPRSKSS